MLRNFDSLYYCFRRAVRRRNFERDFRKFFGGKTVFACFQIVAFYVRQNRFFAVAASGNGEKTVLADVKGNYLKTRKHSFAAEKFAEIALEISATNGAAEAIVKAVKIS